MPEIPQAERCCKNCGRWRRAKDAKDAGKSYREIAKEVGLQCSMCERHPSAKTLARMWAIKGFTMTDQWTEIEQKGEG